MLSDKNRLRNRKLIVKILKNGWRFYGNYLNLYILKSENVKFAVIAGLKVSKKAVERNLIKRRVREILRSGIPLLNNSFMGIIIIKPEALREKFITIQKELMNLLKKADDKSDSSYLN